MSDDLSLFRDSLHDITLMKQDVADNKKPTADPTAFEQRQKAAVTEREDKNHLSDFIVSEVKAYDIIEFKRPGVQNGVFRNLRLGKYEYDARLDLHNCTVAQARTELYQFIHESVNYDLRCISILHGKGGKPPEYKAIIKSHCAQWLKDMPEVLAYHSAPNNQGGAGALNILLVKSEAAKERNREKYGSPP